MNNNTLKQQHDTAEEFEQQEAERLRQNLFGAYTMLVDPENGWNTPTIQIMGYTLRASFPLHLEGVRSFPVDESDVIIAAFPKSGVLLMQHIVWLIMTQDFDNRTPIDVRIPQIDLPVPYPIKPENLAIYAARAPPRIFKTHLPLMFLPKLAFKGKVIYMYRNAKDVAVSYYHHARAIRTINYRKSFEHFAEIFLNGRVNFGPWTRHVRDYLVESKNNANLLIVSFEEFVLDRASVIRKVAKFLGKYDDLSESVIQRIVLETSIEAMRSNDGVNFDWMSHQGRRHSSEAPFIRKGIIGDWTNYFTEELRETFDKRIKESMEGCEELLV